MKKVMVRFDVELHDNGDYLKAGQVLTVSDTWRKSEGFTPVIVTEAYSYIDQPITVQPAEEVFFMNECFVELR
jgi:hypothetical protein